MNVKDGLVNGTLRVLGTTKSNKIEANQIAGDIAHTTVYTTTSSAAGRFSVSIPGITALKDGMSIRVQLNNTYNSTYNTLNLNSLGEKVIYYKYGSIATTHFIQNTILTLTYNNNCSASNYSSFGKAGWLADFDSAQVDLKPNGTDNLIVDNKVNAVYLPDYLLGQVLFGGTFNARKALAALSTGARSKLGTTSANITLVAEESASTITGWKKNEGIYYLVQTGGTFSSISFSVGDWLISTGRSWTKIDNTDAVTGVKGNAESSYRTGNVNITPENIGFANNSGRAGVAKYGLGSDYGATIDDSSHIVTLVNPDDTQINDRSTNPVPITTSTFDKAVREAFLSAPTNGGLGNLTDEQKSTARDRIGAGRTKLRILMEYN